MESRKKLSVLTAMAVTLGMSSHQTVGGTPRRKVRPKGAQITQSDPYIIKKEHVVTSEVSLRNLSYELRLEIYKDHFVTAYASNAKNALKKIDKEVLKRAYLLGFLNMEYPKDIRKVAGVRKQYELGKKRRHEEV